MANAYNYEGRYPARHGLGRVEGPVNALRYGARPNLTVTRSRNTLTCPSDFPKPSDMAFASGITWHNYTVNFGNADIYQCRAPTPGGYYRWEMYPDVVWLGAATFSDSDSTQRFYPSRAMCYGFASITDGTSNTLMAGEVIKGRARITAASPGGGTPSAPRRTCRRIARSRMS